MTRAPALLVFSDLDGTLLSHEGYSWAAAAPALVALKAARCGLVLASSKTAAEIAPLRRAMGFEDWPAIVENGAGLLPAGSAPERTGARYDALRAALATLPPGFRGFGDMSAEDVAEITGLSLDASRLAKAREFTEPGLWQGDEAGLTAFLGAAQAAGLHARRGGRFLTLSFGGTKASQMDAIIAAENPTRTVALGDAPNDVEMLERADLGVVVANPSAPPLPRLKCETEGCIIRTQATGPEGWREAMLPEIAHLNASSADTRPTPIKDKARHG
jgi:mannosyl-3-phosphoglycerate phosphatase